MHDLHSGGPGLHVHNHRAGEETVRGVLEEDARAQSSNPGTSKLCRYICTSWVNLGPFFYRLLVLLFFPWKKRGNGENNGMSPAQRSDFD